MTKRLKQRLASVDAVEADLLQDCDEISEIISRMHGKIQSHKSTRENEAGCLTGAVQDYISAFDSQISSMKERLNADKETWQAKIAAQEKTSR